MFRRHWSGLPKDASFPSDLNGLGYFINDQDEIRSIENPDFYFKFFLNKNERINSRQRFQFNRALEEIVEKRLYDVGLEKIALPPMTELSSPHVPILATPNIKSASRIVVIVGEPTQDLGIIAGRVANGPGGIDKGTMISVVKALQTQVASSTDSSPPGVILANPGQLYWWPEKRRALTLIESVAIPLPSLVHAGRRHVPSLNNIPENEDPAAHVKCLFQKFLKTAIENHVKFDIVAIGQSCEVMERFFDNDENWKTWGSRLNAMLLLGSVYSTEDLTNTGFKEFLANRTRGYINSADPLDTPLAPPAGNPREQILDLGCPTFSASEPYQTEMILIHALGPALDYLQEVAIAGASFENPPIVVVERSEKEPELTEEDWGAVPDEQKPSMSVMDNSVILEEVKRLRRWRRFEETGEAPAWDSDNSENGDAF